MSDKDYRDFLTLQQMSVSDEVKKRQLLDLMFNDTKKVGESAMKRLDIMCLKRHLPTLSPESGYRLQVLELLRLRLV